MIGSVPITESGSRYPSTSDLAPDEPPGRGLGRSRGGLSTKIHHLVDGHGLPLVIVGAAAQANDASALLPLLGQLRVTRPVGRRPRIRPDRLRGDKAYSSRAIRRHLCERDIDAVIPEPSDQIGHRKDAAHAAADPRPSTRPTTATATSLSGAYATSNNGAWLTFPLRSDLQLGGADKGWDEWRQGDVAAERSGVVP